VLAKGKQNDEKHGPNKLNRDWTQMLAKGKQNDEKHGPNKLNGLNTDAREG
jgi:hypothetical protein